MKYDEKSKNMKSLGALRKAKKTKPRSPDLTGQITLLRHTFEAICREFKSSKQDKVVCNIAAWRNTDKNGKPSLNVELSARYVRPASVDDNSDIFEYIFGEDNE